MPWPWEESGSVGGSGSSGPGNAPSKSEQAAKARARRALLFGRAVERRAALAKAKRRSLLGNSTSAGDGPTPPMLEAGWTCFSGRELAEAQNLLDGAPPGTIDTSAAGEDDNTDDDEDVRTMEEDDEEEQGGGGLRLDTEAGIVGQAGGGAAAETSGTAPSRQEMLQLLRRRPPSTERLLRSASDPPMPTADSLVKQDLVVVVYGARGLDVPPFPIGQRFFDRQPRRMPPGYGEGPRVCRPGLYVEFGGPRTGVWRTDPAPSFGPSAFWGESNAFKASLTPQSLPRRLAVLAKAEERLQTSAQHLSHLAVLLQEHAKDVAAWRRDLRSMLARANASHREAPADDGSPGRVLRLAMSGRSHVPFAGRPDAGGRHGNRGGGQESKGGDTGDEEDDPWSSTMPGTRFAFTFDRDHVATLAPSGSEAAGGRGEADWEQLVGDLRQSIRSSYAQEREARDWDHRTHAQIGRVQAMLSELELALRGWEAAGAA